VALAERRGRGRQPWRVKYKLPSGVETSESGFETKAAALAWGRDQEARIREGRWTDPDAGKTTVSGPVSDSLDYSCGMESGWWPSASGSIRLGRRDSTMQASLSGQLQPSRGHLAVVP
jgi:hypothetical protein